MLKALLIVLGHAASILGEPVLSALDEPPRLRVDFDPPPAEPAPYVLCRQGEGAGPTVMEKRLRLLQGPNESNAIIFPQVAPELHGRVQARWDMRVTEGAEGYSFVILNTQIHGVEGEAPKVEAWEEPNLKGCFAIGFDASNPPTDDPFDANGNVYGRPQHEVSLHWNGVEIANRRARTDFRGEGIRRARVKIDFVPGGAEVMVGVGNEAVYRDYFIPGLTPYTGRVAFGGRSGSKAGEVLLDNIDVTWLNPIEPPKPPKVIKVFEEGVIKAGQSKITKEIEFPRFEEGSIGRVVLTLTLGEPPDGYDPWDRSAAVYLYEENGERFELVRFITPYKRDHAWSVDVTDYLPLFSGKKKMEAWCETYGPGWLVSVDVSFHPGKLEHVPFKVENLWSGSPEIGNPDKPLSDFYKPRTIVPPKETKWAKLRLTVTGHGQAPNTGNAAEFLKLNRAVLLGEKRVENVLWKDDGYLNPCRPQGGTWKYDRAGWAPGAVVLPWEIDLSPEITPGKPLKIGYELEPYINENRGQAPPPLHWTESQVIYYKTS